MIGICFIALILLIWFKTDAWLEYTRLLRLNCLSFYKDFDAKYKEDLSLEYIHYLRRDHNCFFVRLITCPICISVWMGIIFAVIWTPIFFPIYVIGGLIVYLIINRMIG